MKLFSVLAAAAHAEIRAQLLVRDAPSWFVENVLTSYTFANPAYLEALRFSPYNYVSPKIPKTIALAHVDKDGVLHIPRGIDPKQNLLRKSERFFYQLRWHDKRLRAPVKFPQRRLSLNMTQKKLLAAFTLALEDDIRPFGNVLLVAPTSGGKTMAQAVCAAATGQRTLVICVTNLIRDAWVKDLQKLYGLRKDDIGLIQQSKWKIGKQFTLASIATLHRRKSRWKELFKQTGCLVLDEAHKVSVPMLYDFVSACPAKYLIGATATPQADRNIHLPAAFGPAVKRLFTQDVDTESSMALRGADVTKTAFTYAYDPQNLDFHDLLIHLGVDEERNQLICDNAYKDWKKGHSVLIVVKRKQHMWMLYEMLHERGVKDTNLIYGGTNTSARRTSMLVKGVLNRSVRMVVAIDQAVKLGANLNPLNRLHVAVPVKRDDLDQLIGRIRRRDKFKIDTRIRYYLDHRVRYLYNRYADHFVPLMRKMKIEGFENLFLA